MLKCTILRGIFLNIALILLFYAEWYRDGAVNTVEENSSIFSLIRIL